MYDACLQMLIVFVNSATNLARLVRLSLALVWTAHLSGRANDVVPQTDMLKRLRRSLD